MITFFTRLQFALARLHKKQPLDEIFSHVTLPSVKSCIKKVEQNLKRCKEESRNSWIWERGQGIMSEFAKSKHALQREMPFVDRRDAGQLYALLGEGGQ